MRSRTVRPSTTKDRSGLLSQLSRLPVGSLATVIAGPGYGKSTLLREWLDVTPVAAVIIPLDERHNDRDELGRHLVRRLSRVVGSLKALPISSAMPDWDRELLPQLTSLLAHTQVIPLFDDVQVLSSRPALELLTTFINQHLKTGVVLLSGRQLPPLGSLSSAVHTVKVTSRHLRLRLTDVEQLAKGSVDAATAEQIARSTWGWPAGVRVALAMLKRGADAPHLSGGDDSDDWIRLYFEDEVLAALTPAQSELLFACAVAGPLDAAVLQSLVPHAPIDAQLDELARLDLPLVAISPDSAVPVILHDLARDAFAARLRRVAPDRYRELLLAASDELLSAGQDREAFLRLARLNDRQLMKAFVEERGFHLALQGSVGPLRRWLDYFRSGEVLSSPGLLFIRALMAAIDCDTPSMQHWLGLYLRVAQGRPVDAEGDTADLNDPAIMAAALMEITGVEPVGSGVHGVRRSQGPFGALAQILAATALGAAGMFELGLALLDDVLDSVEGYPLLEIQYHGARSSMLAQLDRIEEGEQALAHSKEIAERAGLADSLLALTNDVQDAWFLARAERIDEANATLTRARTKLADVKDGMAIARLSWATTLAEAALMMGEHATALTLVEEAEILLAHEPDATAIADGLGKIRAQLQVPGRAAASSTLTTSEIGVLRYLGSFLTVPRIAQELGLSPATVRAHTQNIYKKLHSHGRAAAVAEGRRLGILPEIA